jgi:catechol 2,3-dioxygenase-like lactoylglutathione lyase family enzyme
MPLKAGWCTPLVHVHDVARSIRFYEKLGFELIDTEGDDDCLGWARVHCEGGALMFVPSEHEVNADQQGVLFYLYTEDLAGLRDQLLAQGVTCSEIHRPEYNPSGEISLRDPDGYCILVGHWGQSEHDAWLQRIPEKQAKWAERS